MGGRKKRSCQGGKEVVIQLGGFVFFGRALTAPYQLIGFQEIIASRASSSRDAKSLLLSARLRGMALRMPRLPVQSINQGIRKNRG